MNLKVFENHGQDSRYRDMGEVCETVSAKYGTGGGNQPLVAYGLHPFIANANTDKPHHGPDGDGFKKEQSFTIAAMGVPKVAKCVAIQGTVISRAEKNGPNGQGYEDDGKCFTLTSTDRHAVADEMAVRRLTPVECERLQGMPDNYTRIPYRGKPAEQCPDSPRYKARGNSWAVPVVRWIGKRIDKALKGEEL